MTQDSEICDALNSGSCYINGTLFEQDFNENCYGCSPSVDATWWSPFSNVSCSLDALCTSDSMCSEGQCIVGSISDGFCFIDGACVAAGTVSAAFSCLSCNESITQEDWSVLPTFCWIDYNCYNNAQQFDNDLPCLVKTLFFYSNVE